MIFFFVVYVVNVADVRIESRMIIFLTFSPFLLCIIPQSAFALL